MATIGLSQAVAILTSQAMGAQRWQSVRQVSEAGLCIMLAIAVIFAALFLLQPEHLLDLYLDIKQSTHSRVVTLGTHFMEIAAVYILFDGCRSMMTAALRGMHDAHIPMRMGLGCMWLIGLPVAAIMGLCPRRPRCATLWVRRLGCHCNSMAVDSLSQSA